MRRVFVCVCAVVVFVLAGVVEVQAESVTLGWDANTEPDLAGYILEYGTAPGQYTQSQTTGKVTQFTIPGLLPDTTYYFAVKAYNTSGVASAPSNEVVYRTQSILGRTLSRVGGSVLGFTPGTTVRGTDTAYDPARDVFLVVFGEGPIYGAFVDSTGNPVTAAFTIANSATSPGHFPRAKYSPHAANGAGGQGAFLVTWHQVVGQQKHVFGRLVSFGAPGGLASGIRQISDNQDGSWPEPGPAVAYSSTSRRFLVGWKTSQSGLRGRFVDTTGTPVGASIQFEASGSSSPSLAWNAASNEFGLAFGGSNSSGEFAAFRRIGAATGAVSSRDTFGFTPKVFATGIDVNSVTNDYVVVWALGPGTMSATFDQFGARLATNFVTDRLGFDNSLGLAFNENTGTFLVVSSDRDSLDVAAVELKGNGAPNSLAEPVTAGATVGSFHPQAAARTGTIQWQVGYSFDLRTSATQLVSSSTLGGGMSQPPGTSSGTACPGTDPFVALGGGTCCNGGWLPPGMVCTYVAPAPSTSTTTAPPPPSGTTSSSTACPGTDPFVALGGGTCCNGGWLPPGMACSVSAPPSASTPPPATAPPPSTTTISSVACPGTDPFVALGGGTCCNGGWLPPGMFCSVWAPASTSPPTTTTTTTTPPPSGTTSTGAACTGSDPFVALGGGKCCNGGWLPPGMTCSFAPSPSTVPPPSSTTTSDGACVGGDPFVALGGGKCCNGGWLPPGIACSAK